MVNSGVLNTLTGPIVPFTRARAFTFPSCHGSRSRMGWLGGGPKKKKNQLTNSPSERTPLGLLVLQHEIGHLDQQAALAAHHPDLLELSSHLALPVGQISSSCNGCI